MGKLQVIESECDRCHHVETGPMAKRKRGELDLPKGWLHVSGNTSTALVFEVDLCEACKGTVLSAAGSARVALS